MLVNSLGTVTVLASSKDMVSSDLGAEGAAAAGAAAMPVEPAAPGMLGEPGMVGKEGIAGPDAPEFMLAVPSAL